MSWVDRIGRFFPLPFVGVTLLLVLLILFTPVLISGGQPAAGSILSQAELIVDSSGNNTTHFYVRGLGSTARYLELELGFAFEFPWTPSAFPTATLNWTDWQNGTDVLSVIGVVDQLPVAVNVTALYYAGGVSALYVGVFAIDVGFPSGATTEMITVLSGTSGISGFSLPVSDLPIPITLAYVGSGGGP